MATSRRPTSASRSTPARPPTGKGQAKTRTQSQARGPGKTSHKAAGRPAGKPARPGSGRPPRPPQGGARSGKGGPGGKGAQGSRRGKAPRAAGAAYVARLVPRSRELVALEKLVLASLDDMKAVNVKILDVRGLTDVADTMIVASGTSDRHVRAIAERVIEHAKAAGRRPMGTEGKQDGEWVLVDLQDVLLHVMLPRVREFYALEQLWESPAAGRRPQPA